MNYALKIARTPLARSPCSKSITDNTDTTDLFFTDFCLDYCFIWISMRLCGALIFTDLTLSLQKNATQSHKLQNNQGKSMIAEDSFVPLL